jgi:hypothetical protein
VGDLKKWVQTIVSEIGGKVSKFEGYMDEEIDKIRKIKISKEDLEEFYYNSQNKANGDEVRIFKILNNFITGFQ